MASPFPGMDPYIEMQEWEDFHTTFNTVVREMLSPLLQPRYLVRVERRMPEERRATCLSILTIRKRKSMDVVTNMQILSPATKSQGAEERRKYLDRRREVFRSTCHLVELDLLRNGERLPLRGPVPEGDYLAIVSRGHRRPEADVYAWTIRDPLPVIPIPLLPDDGDASLALQEAFTTVYERAMYELSLDYSAPLQPPLSETDAEWMRELLDQFGSDAPGESGG